MGRSRERDSQLGNRPPGVESVADSAAHALDSPPWQRVESTLMSIADGIRDGYDHRLRPLGLSLNTASLLAYIDEFGPVNQSRAAEHLGQGRASTGKQIDKLERDGFLQRTADLGDRRAWLIETTASGHDLVNEINEVDKVFREQLRAGTTRSERQALASLLLRLQSNLDEANQTTAATVTGGNGVVA